MSDPELEAIRQQRLAQLQSQYKVNQLWLETKYFIPFMCVCVYIYASIIMIYLRKPLIKKQIKTINHNNILFSISWQ